MTNLRRRIMMALGGGTPPTPPTPGLEFFDYLVGDGTAYVDTGYTLPALASMAGYFGHETRKAGSQNLFGVWEVGYGATGLTFGGSTNSTRRQFVAFYDKSTNVGSKFLAFTSAWFGAILTPKRFGFGGDTSTLTRGSAKPAGTVKVFGGYPSYTAYSGVLAGDFTIYDSSAQDATTYAALIAMTPVATFRPCVYNGEAGLWHVEAGTFHGNAAGSGTLIATNSL